MQQLNDRVLAFADDLRQHRRARGLTQVELAERAQLSERAISDLERGLKTPQRATLRLLTKALELSPDEAEHFERTARSRVSSKDRAATAPRNLLHEPLTSR